MQSSLLQKRKATGSSTLHSASEGIESKEEHPHAQFMCMKTLFLFAREPTECCPLPEILVAGRILGRQLGRVRIVPIDLITHPYRIWSNLVGKFGCHPQRPNPPRLGRLGWGPHNSTQSNSFGSCNTRIGFCSLARPALPSLLGTTHLCPRHRSECSKYIGAWFPRRTIFGEIHDSQLAAKIPAWIFHAFLIIFSSGSHDFLIVFGAC